MDEEKSACKCKCDLNNTPFIGSIIAYELAVVIVIMIFILWDLDELSEQPSNDLQQTTESI